MKPLKKTFLTLIPILLVMLFFTALFYLYALKTKSPVYQTPWERHGTLHVEGTSLTDEHGKPVQLCGVSTSHIGWYPQYINYNCFKTLRDDWNVSLIRICMYTQAFGTGYCDSNRQEEYLTMIDQGVNAARELGLYVIIDWHTLEDYDPNFHIEESKEFFQMMSEKYADYGNVIYEICNEPNGYGTWDKIKSYAETIIPIIRTNDPDSLILIAPSTYAQDVDIASLDPVTGYDNLMYTVHFYAGSHKEPIREKVRVALSNGLPVFVSECSITEALLDGRIDYAEGNKWFDLIQENQLSFAAFAFCNADEIYCMIKPECDSVSGWTREDLTETGLWFRDLLWSMPEKNAPMPQDIHDGGSK